MAPAALPRRCCTAPQWQLRGRRLWMARGTQHTSLLGFLPSTALVALGTLFGQALSGVAITGSQPMLHNLCPQAFWATHGCGCSSSWVRRLAGDSCPHPRASADS